MQEICPSFVNFHHVKFQHKKILKTHGISSDITERLMIHSFIVSSNLPNNAK